MTDDPWWRLGQAIKRERGGRSQTDLADLIAVRQATWSDWERGKSKPTVEQIRRIEQVLGVPAGYLLRAAGFVDDPTTRTTAEAIMADPDLDPDFKRTLLRAYRSFRDSPREDP